MHPSSLWAVGLLASALAAGPALAADCATVQVDNLQPGQGHLMVAAYGDAATYGKQALAQVRVKVGDGASQNVQLCSLATSGPLALMVYQDIDSDGRLARNLLGMPSEPWGGSGQPGMTGPSWENGKVPLDGQPIRVKMVR